MRASAPNSAFLARCRSEGACQYHTDIMGFGLIGETELALVSNIAAAQLCISKVKNLIPYPFTVLDWPINDIPTTVAALKFIGDEKLVDDFIEPDENHIRTLPERERQMAEFKDLDDNILFISQAS